jgi:protein-tyrosine phosphatase
MHSRVYWIDLPSPWRLAIMARPRSGDWLVDEIQGWSLENVSVVASMLERDEVVELGLEQEASLCASSGIEFVSYPIADRSVPLAKSETHRLAQRLASDVQSERAVAIHCRIGIGRSSLLAACTMHYLGIEPIAAFEAISKSRGLTVPDTEAQRQWVLDFSQDTKNQL